MHKASDRIENLSESQTIAMSQRSRELQQQGIDIINLSLGEPDFPTPMFINDAAKKAIDNNFTKYTPVSGYQDLREAISLKFKRDNNIDYNINQIVVSTGAKQTIANAVLSLVNPGDEVIVPAPYWVSYIEIIKMAEGIPVIVEATIKNDFKITAEQLKNAITDKTKMMIYSSPCNPTGSIYSKAELAALAKVIATKKDFYVLSDEIYEHINFVGKHESLAQFPEIYEQVITVNGVSKGFAMTGWRLGFMGAPKWIAAACDKMQGQFTSGTCSITQKAVVAAMNADPSVTFEMRDAFHQRRDYVLSRLNQIEGVKTNTPEGAFYVFPDISAFFGKNHQGKTIENATDLSMYLLEEAQVAIVTGEAFGSPNCIRFSYATSLDVLEKAMNRIERALNDLN
ncbi:MAG: pyridoxal phosphate-dependent aminotransferase [Bacteroidetes bacterium]|nr:MAG: pyridoxal phosphate-dependent aminotransferase [Bacteroidota bacterium]MBL1144328.1 pyridoxal phosphate-dependent aminotransferase [Bacteroidota bacterium]NOG57124.1 pyridoxal phosphate-dependent aminotransferase [Bacteroidota bacterium]